VAGFVAITDGRQSWGAAGSVPIS
jgi:hypothetical protein